METTKRSVPESMYYELCKTIAEFKEAPANDWEEGWASDGEWLDVFYELCVKLKTEMDKNG